MKSVLIIVTAIMSLLVAYPAAAALAVGDTAPEFSIQGTQGDTNMTIDLFDLLKNGPVVIYFFPSVFTDTNASREFADNIAAFHAAGASVVGFSRDSIDTLARFSTEVCAGRFPVASASESLVNAFDVNDGAMFNTRTTYVVDPAGKIVFVHDDQDYSGHVKRALAFLQGASKPH